MLRSCFIIIHLKRIGVILSLSKDDFMVPFVSAQGKLKLTMTGIYL